MGKGSSQIKFAGFFVSIDKDCIDVSIWSSDLVANHYVLFFYTILTWDSDEMNTVFDILETLKSEGICRLTKGNQPFHIVTALDIFRICFSICSLSPVKFVDSITRVVRVMDEVRIVKWIAVLITQQVRFVWNLILCYWSLVGWVTELFGATIFLTRVDKWSSLSCQDHEVSKSQTTMNFSIVLSLAWVFFDRLGDDVKEGQVIMGCDILDNISRAVSFKVGWLSNEIFKDGVDITLATCDKGRLPFVWITRLEVVTDVV